MYKIFSNQTDNEEIYRYYITHNNYEICEGMGNNEEVWIFFSSHGLYYPTTIEMFRERVVNSDFYEWRNISKNKKINLKASKFIFIRDIYKNWCLEGINGKVNSPIRLAEMLSELLDGKEIVTIGSSAGGTMAIMLGCMLNAKKIYAFSPQISLIRYNKFHPINNYEYYSSELSQFTELRTMIEGYHGDLYYFFPNSSPEDVAQYESIMDCDIPKIFSINYSEHGLPLYGASLIETLSMPDEKLKSLYLKYKNKKVSREKYLIDTCGLSAAAINILGRKIKRLIRW